MGRFIAIRLLQFPLILAIIYLITFMLVWVAPGDPFQRTDKKVDPKSVAGPKRADARHALVDIPGVLPAAHAARRSGPEHRI